MKTYIDKSTFLELAEVQSPHAISMYIPFHSADDVEGKRQNKIVLKNTIKRLKAELEQYGLEENSTNDIIESFNAFGEDDQLWTSSDSGVVLFYYNDSLSSFHLSQEIEEIVYISNHLYLAPLAKELPDSTLFYVLALSLGKVKLYQADEIEMTEIDISKNMPTSLEEALGKQLEEPSLQFRSGQGHGDESLYHGHGRGSQTEKKEEALQFFRKVNEGISSFLKAKEAPLMIACVDYLFPIYQKVNSYEHLLEEPLEGNYENASIHELYDLASKKLRDSQTSELSSIIASIEANLSTGEASYSPETVIPAAIGGRVENLLVDKNENLWGVYVQENHSIRIDAEKKNTNTDLLNKAVVSTIQNSGQVYFVEKEDIEFSGSPVAALLRY